MGFRHKSYVLCYRILIMSSPDYELVSHLLSLGWYSIVNNLDTLNLYCPNL